MITQTFDLNMVPESAPEVVKCDQYDVGNGRLVASLYNGNVAYTPSAGATAIIQGTKPDGLGFAYSATISGSTVTCDLTEQMTAVAGRTRVNLVITEGDNRTGTFVFWLDVQATGLADDVDISETEIPAYISAAQSAALNAEAWAVGERGGVPVSSSDETYENNAKYYANEAADSATSAYASEQNASDSATNAHTSELNAASSASDAYDSEVNASSSASNAHTSEQNASSSESNASASEARAKSWAVGPNGAGTSGTDTNNARYWASVAEQAADISYDNVPVKNSAHAVRSGGIYDSVVGNTELIEDTVGWTGKNLIPTEVTSKTQNGITFTVNNNDKSVTVSGTASADARLDYNLYLDIGTSLTNNTYILSGCPSGGSTSTFYIYANIHNTSDDSFAANMNDIGTGATRFVSSSNYIRSVVIKVFSGTNISTPITFYPMLRKADILDDTYEPYHKTVAELLEDIPTSLDDTVTQSSSNAVKSSGIYSALGLKADASDLTAKQPKTLDTPITIKGTQYTTVETVLSALVNIVAPPLVSWSSATDAQIAAIVNAYYAGTITFAQIQEYWHVGDVREMSISAIEATGTANGFTWSVGETHHAQTVDVVILGFEHDDLTTSINGHSKALVTIGMKNCLYMGSSKPTSSNTDGSSNTENGYINSTNTNVGGWTSSARRQWCNGGFYNSMPNEIKGVVKQVQKQTTAGNQSATMNTDNDYIFLPSEYEVFGTVSGAKAQEGNQYSYYTTAANRYKYPKWDSSAVSNHWWERSPCGSNSMFFCFFDSNGSAGINYATGTFGLAPSWAL